MSSRLLPYATSPGRLLAQLFSDVGVAVWSLVWLLVGVAVHSAISTIAAVGDQVHSGANGVAENLESAGSSADHIPLVGDTVSKPLTAASAAALDIAGAGHTLDTTASWLAVVLAIAVAAPPIAAVAVPWLVLRLRFFRRKRMVLALAATPAASSCWRCGRDEPPAAQLADISPDPVGAWRHQDLAAICGLAGLELRSAGLRRRSR
ncbi:hypothetical protein C1Y40_00524 [Mycobacterium talmoniae]|uniref:Transmembrane protein n=1 Tax=Mycobacterium talmoniae TaxID=1858794 RepID=A0A2S8BRJ7_9MYCO|nr:hypothetical protein C1Y40_00524 [Mycobacterium talmoniae]